MKPEYKDNLKKCETLQQIFDLTKEYYYTNEKMGMIAGNIVRAKIPDIIKMLNLKPTK